MQNTNTERRRHPRGNDIMTRLEDLTYAILRKTQADSQQKNFFAGNHDTFLMSQNCAA